ncbi:hypothetical protein JAAARDRAFT_197885 [Jaapia argillacea MUCL 33604]|uniref:Carboxylic ester hydrolase n=1 Tax=Jaapia argillacea MUCL 33604 TaxID=933084 RepID=A0A067PND3_9AGAM|nr:hypothetical protein JAAARDRAFT_197885 [Jaapia argillacea MUCL 33604]
MSDAHLHDELTSNPARVTADTKFGRLTGGRAANGAAVWLEVPYALPPGRFQDPKPLPSGFQYEDKEYIREDTYAVQPLVDGQSAATPFVDKVGRGKPTENPLFVNIIAPPSFPSRKDFPVKIYIHGGFLQFGSPHGLSSQAQYVAASRNEVWVNIGYRLSIFGFLACDEPRIPGNFGFKDQWLACQWIKENIAAFGGNPEDITISGLSAGAHSLHQLLHHASRLPEGQNAPFHTAILQSNSIVANPKPPSVLREQYNAVCDALSLDPSSPTSFTTLSDPSAIPASKLTELIDSDKLGIYGTFRGCLEPEWYTGGQSDSVDLMEWQRSGGLAKGLKEKGVKKIVVGEMMEEWYLYSIAHPVHGVGDIKFNLERYYERHDIDKVLNCYRTLPANAPLADIVRLMGEILSDGQVYLPVRFLARDMMKHGYPILRYEIRWSPEQRRPLGYVTHGTDRALWALRIPSLEADQVPIATAWLDAIDDGIKNLEKGNEQGLQKVMALKEDRTIGWIDDERWEQVMKVGEALES